MKKNITTQEIMDMEIKDGNAREEIDMTQRKAEDNDLIVTEEDMEMPEESLSVDALVSMIDARIKEMEEKEKCLKMEEKEIMECIKATLDEHKVKYSYDSDRDKMVEMVFGADNKVFRVRIILQNGKVIYELAFPFRVQCNTLALVALYMAQFNEDKAFALMNLDLEDGEATMEYSYLLDQAEDFDAEHFWIYLMSLVHLAQEEYTRLSHLAVGKVSKEVKALYKALLEQSLAVINGEDDEDSVIYGCENLQTGKNPKEEFLKRQIRCLNPLGEMEDTDEDDRGSRGSEDDIFLPFDDTDEDDELKATGTEE